MSIIGAWNQHANNHSALSKLHGKNSTSYKLAYAIFVPVSSDCTVLLERGYKMQTCRENPFKYLMLNLLYPAFLGSTIYQCLERPTLAMPKLLGNLSLLSQHITYLNILRVAIMSLIIVHFIFDYLFLQIQLYDKTIKYNWILFAIDFLVIIVFPFVLPSLSCQSGVYNKWINPFSLYSATYFLFYVWICIFLKINTNHKAAESHRITRNRFFVLFIICLIISVIDFICRTCPQYQSIIFHLMNYVFILAVSYSCLLLYCVSFEKDPNPKQLLLCILQKIRKHDPSS